MSHTTDLGNGWIAIHDGDLRNSADIILMKNKQVKVGESREYIVDAQIEVPFEVLEELIAKAIVDRKISILEDMSAGEILYK